MIVYARKEKTYIWSDNNGSHKAGWVPLYEPLYTGGESPSGWYGIERPQNLSLPEDPNYPFYWVKVGDTTEATETGPAPLPEPTDSITDEDAAWAMVVLLKWLKQ